MGSHDSNTIEAREVETGWDGRIPTLEDVFRARAVIRKHLSPTPLLKSDALSDRLGFEVRIKCENIQPTGAFKVRGGLYFMSLLSQDERARGVVAASTGNHGQSVAYAARTYESHATVFVPEGANSLKVAAMQRLGARVIAWGKDFDECREESARYAERIGAVYIHSANEPNLIAGVGTHTLEILEQEPDVDAVFVAIGGGSGLCGAVIAGKGIKPGLQVVGVQAENAPVVRDSWRSRTLLRYDAAPTFAEGIATREAFSLPAAILWDRVDDIVTVSESALKRSMLTLLETTRLLVEGAGAAGLAGAWLLRDSLQGKKVAIIVSGGNVTLERLALIMQEERAW